MMTSWPVEITYRRLFGHGTPMPFGWCGFDKFEGLAALCDEHSIVAGGAVRDVLLDADPRDIDVFVSGAGLDAAQARVLEQVEHELVAIADQIGARHGDSGSARGLRAVLNYGDVQIIHVDDPWARVQVFDAICNMVWVDMTGRAWAASDTVIDHIRAKRWEPNPHSVMTPSEYNARRAKFLDRGWIVPAVDARGRHIPEVRTGLQATVLEITAARNKVVIPAMVATQARKGDGR